MRKRLLGITFTMVLLSAILLLYQWMLYAEQIEPQANDVTPSITTFASINEQEDSLTINLTYSNLQEGVYTIKKPINISSFYCREESGKRCSITGDQLQILEKSTVVFNYTLPIGNEKMIFFTDWIVQIEQIERHKMSVSLSTPSLEDRIWIATNNPIYEENLSRIYYIEWEFDVDDPIVLAKINSNHFHYSINNLQVYSEFPLDVSFTDDMFSDFKNQNQLIIVSPDQDIVKHKGVAVLNHFEKRQVISALLTSHLLSNTVVPDEQKWLIDVLSDYFYLTNNEDDDVSKVVDLLNESLDQDTKNQWFQEIINWDDNRTDLVTMLDYTLQLVTNLNTTFFSSNMNNQGIPLFGFDERHILVNGENQTVGWKNINYKNQHYIPLAGLAELTDLNVIALNDGYEIFIQYESNRYRFFMNDHLFIINEENYHFHDELLVKIEDEVYINTVQANDIFPFNLTLTPTELKIEK